MYAGRVDCIFIDPPYNTGNEGWCYNDNVNSPMLREWLNSNPVSIGDGLRHDKWLCMMWSRLRLLHELLSESGSLWMTLNDNEIHRARMMMDEIFQREGAFAVCIVWQKKYATANDQTGIAPVHDYLLVYQKIEWQRNLLERTKNNDTAYRFEDRKVYLESVTTPATRQAEERHNLFYPIKNPNTGEEVWPNRKRVWAYSRQEHERHIAEDLIFWGKDGKAKIPSFKRYRHLLKTGGGTVPGTWWTHDFAGHTDLARKQLLEVMPDLAQPPAATITPKPLQLIERVIPAATQPDSIIFDSFAGSGTTAHAVLAANAKDGGDRKFILVDAKTTPTA